jgi:hypothetical protein
MEMGTEILLARMKEYPEEFINLKDRAIGYDSLRWDAVMREGREYLPEEDRKALDAGMKQLYIDRFNERVLKTLAGESEPEQPEETLKYKTQGRYATGFTDPRGVFGGPPVKAEGVQISAQHQQLMAEQQRHMEQHRRMMNNAAQNSLGVGLSGMSFEDFFGGKK